MWSGTGRRGLTVPRLSGSLPFTCSEPWVSATLQIAVLLASTHLQDFPVATAWKCFWRIALSERRQGEEGNSGGGGDTRSFIAGRRRRRRKVHRRSCQSHWLVGDKASTRGGGVLAGGLALKSRSHTARRPQWTWSGRRRRPRHRRPFSAGRRRRRGLRRRARGSSA